MRLPRTSPAWLSTRRCSLAVGALTPSLRAMKTPTAEGREAARSIAIDLMGTVQAALGDLESVKRIVKLMVLVNSVPTFTEQHLVANGASELLVSIFGERGPHARSAFGVAQIPTGSCLEIEMIVEVEGV